MLVSGGKLKPASAAIYPNLSVFIRSAAPSSVMLSTTNSAYASVTIRKTVVANGSIRAIFTPYVHYFTIALSINALIMILSILGPVKQSQNDMAQFALINLVIATAVRSELLLWGLYWLVTSLFAYWPSLQFRRHLVALLHSIGGFHSGCAISATLWTLYLAIDQWKQDLPIVLRVLGVTLPCLLATICLFATKFVAIYFHNTFELSHRFLGWTALFVTWAYILLSAAYDDSSRQFHLSNRGLPYLARLYRRGVWVFTGSGAAVGFSSLLENPDWGLIWVANDFDAMFGTEVMEKFRGYCEAASVLGGRPDLVKMSVDLCRDMGAESRMGTKQKQPAKKLPRNIQKRWKAAATKEAAEEGKWADLEIEELAAQDETDSGTMKKKMKPSQMYRDVLLKQVKEGGVEKKVAEVVGAKKRVKK
ncbi:hypothetical protein BJ741DRAFT_646583 [Chytriomyces cf. hyalinus JEL632]|nr:hypothetical protein BJ741DRAFT_646583 [Chytriomyces cf. hyalinus JEL632]